MTSSFIIISLFCFSNIPEISADCQIDPLQIQPSPLVLNKNAQIIYPESRFSSASIETGETITISCPGNQLMHQGTLIGQTIEATCESDDLFKHNNQIIKFQSLKCQSFPKNTVRYSQKRCPEGGDEIEIGYELASHGVFIRQIQICFDGRTFNPIYSHYNLTGTIGYRDGKVPRVFFEEDGFYSTDQSLDTLYRRDFQRNTINTLLDSPGSSLDYIKSSGEVFINRGHLTAKGDFVYAFQQLATFHYVNAAPQWASFNGGNWNEVEISVRDYADRHKVDLQVFTGVYGVSSLINPRSGDKTDLYLHNVNGRKLLPIPQLFWKLVYDAEGGAGVVLLGVNNAHEFEQSRDVICADISDGISWLSNKLKRQRHSVELGYTYACDVADFRKVVNASPQIDADDLLT